MRGAAVSGEQNEYEAFQNYKITPKNQNDV
jgi:hypothetical protein